MTQSGYDRSINLINNNNKFLGYQQGNNHIKHNLMINNDDERRCDTAKANHYQNTSHSNRSVEAFFQHKLEKSAISRKFFRKELNFDKINGDFFITH